MILDFIRSQQERGRAVESVCRVLSEQGLQVAARTYRAWQCRRTLGPRLLAIAFRQPGNGSPEALTDRRERTVAQVRGCLLVSGRGHLPAASVKIR